MNKEGLKGYDTSYLVLIAFFIVQVFFIFFDIYRTKSLSMENFTIIIIQLISILFACRGEFLPIATFSTIYFLGYIGSTIYNKKYTPVICYSLMLFVPLAIVYSRSIKKTKEESKRDLIKLT